MLSEAGAQTNGSPTDAVGDFRASVVRDGHSLASALRPSPLHETSTSESTAGQGRAQEGVGAPPLKGHNEHARFPTEGAWPRWEMNSYLVERIPLVLPKRFGSGMDCLKEMGRTNPESKEVPNVILRDHEARETYPCPSLGRSATT